MTAPATIRVARVDDRDGSVQLALPAGLTVDRDGRVRAAGRFVGSVDRWDRSGRVDASGQRSSRTWRWVAENGFTSPRRYATRRQAVIALLDGRVSHPLAGEVTA